MTFQELIEDLNYETQSYSGRGMFGKECLAIVVDHPTTVCAEIAFEAGLHTASRTYAEQRHMMALCLGVQVDSMGLQYVVYWPHEPYVKPVHPMAGAL